MNVRDGFIGSQHAPIEECRSARAAILDAAIAGLPGRRAPPADPVDHLRACAAPIADPPVRHGGAEYTPAPSSRNLDRWPMRHRAAAAGEGVPGLSAPSTGGTKRRAADVTQPHDTTDQPDARLAPRRG